MDIIYTNATSDDINPIYELCKRLIENYEQPDAIDYAKIGRAHV